MEDIKMEEIITNEIEMEEIITNEIEMEEHIISEAEAILSDSQVELFVECSDGRTNFLGVAKDGSEQILWGANVTSSDDVDYVLSVLTKNGISHTYTD